MCLFEFDQEKHDRITFNNGIAIGREEGREEGIKQMIIALYSVGISKNIIIEKLIKQYNLSEFEAEKNINKYLPTIN